MLSIDDLIAEWEKLRTQSGNPQQSKQGFYASRFIKVMFCGLAYFICQIGIPQLYFLVAHFYPSIPDSVSAVILFALIFLGFFTGFAAAKVIDSILG